MKYFLPTLLVFSACTGAFAQDKIDQKGRAVLDAASAHLQQAGSFQVDTGLNIQMSAPGMPPRNQNVVHTVSLRDGKSFSMVSKPGGASPQLNLYYHDGVSTLRLGDEAVIVNKDSKELAGFFSSEALGYNANMDSHIFMDQNIAGHWVRNLALPGIQKWDAKVEALSYLGEVDFEGGKAHHLKVTQNTFTMNKKQIVESELWISAGDKPLLLKVQPDMQKVMQAMAAQNPQAASMKFEMSGTLSNWKVGGDIADASFKPGDAGDLPVHASFQDFIQAMQKQQNPASNLIGSDAADFEVDLLAGSKFKLSDHRDKVVILDFWATWCGPCVMALPGLMKVAGDYADKGVVLIAVNQGEKPGKVEKFLKEKKWSLTVAMDPESSVGQLYKVRGIPQTVVVGKDGKIKQVHVGYNPNMEAQLKGELDEILSK